MLASFFFFVLVGHAQRISETFVSLFIDTLWLKVKLGKIGGG